ncbi:diacylglycerol kinase [Candidatus Pelagibacter sp.]|nr:diacylglycerol kinase [Candidatus Pelagibacter sp.]|tara:strand:- start:122 stop:460 length:339 start_codon:yes stop_codon:yes gene_type:complete
MIKKLFLNFLNSINGLKIVFKESSFVLEIILGIILVPYVLLADLIIFIKLLIISTYLLLLASETFNTAIEKLCDKITKKIDPDIKKIKDLSSASVFVVLMILVIQIILIFIF